MWGRLRRWLSSSPADDEEAETGRFIPSVLDASVLFSHGGSNPEGERELAQVEEEARRLEEQEDH